MKTRYFLLVALCAVFCFAVIGLTANMSTLQAAPKVEKENPSTPAPPSDSLRAKMEKAEVHLSTLEKTLARVQETRVITSDDNAALDNSGLALADTLYEAFNEASQSTLKAAETEGREGNVEDLAFFESFEQNHVSRTEAIFARTEQIQKGIEDGTIILKDSPQAAAAKMTKVAYEKKAENNVNLAPGISECPTVGEKSGAKILKPCIAPCLAQRWADCASCIIRSVPAGINYYNQFANCWNSCGGFWKWFCRAKCLAVFVYWIY